jgi:hypothetical protein
MATYKHLRSSTANKRPTTSITDGQLAINTNTASPGLFFKDSAGTGIVKIGPVHVGTTAPNATPAAGGSSGNYLGEQWLDTSVSPAQMKVWNGSAWVGIVADELPVSKLQDGDARQLLQTDAAGTGVEWTSNVDVPGTLDVTSTATFDSIARHPLGSAAAPTLTFTGDPNTGIYSPGADQVAVSTGGTGRVFVDASGRVGVGVTPSSTLFHVYTSAPSTISAPTICLEGGTNAYGAGVEFASRTSAGGTLVSMAKITADGEAPWNTTASTQDAGLRFFTAADGSLSERLRITSAGLVGIGTSSVSDKLEIANGTTDAANAAGIRSGRYLNGGQEGAQLKYYSDNTSSWLGTREVARIGAYGLNSDHRIGSLAFALKTTNSASDPTEMMRLTPTGLGIGTTSPSDLLHSNGNIRVSWGANRVATVFDDSFRQGMAFDTGNRQLQIFSTTSDTGGSIGFFTRSTVGSSDTDYGTEKVRIDVGGRLLVGTTTARSTCKQSGDTSRRRHPWR